MRLTGPELQQARKQSAEFVGRIAAMGPGLRGSVQVQIPVACPGSFRRRRTLIPKGTRTAFRAEGEQFSERSDAGISIVEQVFVFVKQNLSEA
jgi:hypothetical protein